MYKNNGIIITRIKKGVYILMKMKKNLIRGASLLLLLAVSISFSASSCKFKKSDAGKNWYDKTYRIKAYGTEPDEWISLKDPVNGVKDWYDKEIVIEDNWFKLHSENGKAFIRHSGDDPIDCLWNSPNHYGMESDSPWELIYSPGYIYEAAAGIFD